MSLIGWALAEVLKRRGYSVVPRDKYLLTEAAALKQSLSLEPVILDVGAHRGETVSYFKDLFLRATIHAFVPHRENAVMISGATSVNVLALSDNLGRAAFNLFSASKLNSFHSLAGRSAADSVEVEVSTIDAWCAENR